MVRLILFEINKWLHCRLLKISFVVLLAINLLFTCYCSFDKNELVSDIDDAEYSETLETICINADKNMKKLRKIGIKEDQYTYRYQQKIKEIYTVLEENVYISEDIVSPSWSYFFNYDLVNLLVLLYATVLIYVMFLEDRSGGMWHIIRASRNGRSSIISVKIVTFVVIIIAISLLYQSTSLVVLIRLNGGKGVSAAIQKVSGFELAPYNKQILSMLLFVVLQRAIVIASLSMISVFFTVLSGHPIISVFSTLALYLIGYIVSLLPNNSTWMMSNFYTLLSPALSITRYHSVNFFDIPIDSVKTACILITSVFMLSIVGVYAVMLHDKKKASNSKVFKPQFPEKHIPVVSYKPYSMSLTNHEIYKCFDTKTVATILFILLANVSLSYYHYNELKISTSYALVNEYIDSMNGLSNAELLAVAKKDLNDALQTIDMESEVTSRFFGGEINSQFFAEYNQKLSEAKSMIKPLNMLISRTIYLIDIENTKGIICHPIFSKPIEILIGNDFDVLLFIVVIFFSTTLSTIEYQNNSTDVGFLPIMTVCKKGRGKTFTNKIVIAICSVLFFCVLFYITDFIVYAMNADVKLLAIPIVSLPDFEGTDTEISINTWLFLKWISVFLSYVLVVCFTFITSHFIHNTILVYILTTSVTVLPKILFVLGIDVMKYIDYTTLLSGTRIYMISSRYFTFDYTLPFLICTVLFIIEWIALYKCYKEINENR